MEAAYKTEREIEITQEQHEILLGIMLGDAHLELAQNGKSARLCFSQMSEKRFYVEHLHEKLYTWNLSTINVRLREKGSICEFSVNLDLCIPQHCCNIKRYSMMKGKRK